MKVVAKFEKRIQVRKLRQNGWSIGDIAKEVGVAKSSASIWCRDIALSDEQVKVLAKQDADGAYLGRLRAAENRRRERIERMGKYEEIGRKKVGNLSKRDLFIAGLALYWAEGGKKHRRVELINSDPEIIKIWISWLKNFADVGDEDLTACVGINEIHKDRVDEVQRYWSDQTGIPLCQFGRPSFKKVKNLKIYANFNQHFGSLSIRTRRSANLCYEILGQISGLAVRLS